jgi:hypothetical protein
MRSGRYFATVETHDIESLTLFQLKELCTLMASGDDISPTLRTSLVQITIAEERKDLIQ